MEKMSPQQMAALQDSDFYATASWKEKAKPTADSAILYDVTLPSEDLGKTAFCKERGEPTTDHPIQQISTMSLLGLGID